VANDISFETVLEQGQTKNVVGIVIPDAVIAALGAGRRPPVQVTVNGYTYRSTVAVMGGRFMVGLAAGHRAAAGVQGGDRVTVTIAHDAAPRAVAVPDDLAAALDQAALRAAFDALAPSRRKEHVRQVETARSADTRTRRIERVLAALSPTTPA
jgi:hypothetical protein